MGAIAILLALNLLRGEPEAMGQSPPGLGEAPVVPVAMSVVGTRIYRMWSDGSVDSTLVQFSPSCIVANTCTDKVID